jgi:glycosyltransferase involved in cell wall biosynthesis
MKILLANKFYYPRGGDCVYTIDLERLLQAEGHETAVFAMQYPQNLESKWSRFFPSEVAFSPKKPVQFLKALVRPIHSFEVARKFKALLDEFQPDVVHLNNIHTQLSPIIAEIAHKRGIRVVWTLHDYKLLCPRYDCLRNGKPCELCFAGNKSHVLKYSCLKGSKLASFIAWLEARTWSRKRLEASVDAFICPSRFMKEKMEQGEFDPSKLHVLRNFIDPKKVEGPLPEKKDHYCYVGRLSEEKGIRTLLKVASELPYTLKVLGTGPLDAELREQFKGFSQIEFLGHQGWPVIREVLGSARCMVLPSEWYENCPLSALEAQALGTAVIGADIGGIAELLTAEANSLFTSSDDIALNEKIAEMMKKVVAEIPVPTIKFGPSYITSILDLYR